jgi:cytochrome c oxidase subunit 3
MAVATANRPAPAEPEYPGLHVGMMGMYIFLTSEVMFFGSLFATYFYLLASHGQWPPPGPVYVSWFPVPAINTAVLISSGVTCHFALEAVSQGGTLSRGAGRLAAGLMGIFIVIEVILAALAMSSGSVAGAGLAAFSILISIVAIAIMLGAGPFGTGRATFIGLLVATILLGAAFEFGQGYEFANAYLNEGLTFNRNEFASAFFTMTGFHGAHVLGGLVILALVLGRALKGQFSAQHHVGVAAATLYWHFVDVVWVFLFTVLYLGVTLGGNPGG